MEAVVAIAFVAVVSLAMAGLLAVVERADGSARFVIRDGRVRLNRKEQYGRQG